MMNRTRTVLAALALMSATLLPARAGLAGPPKNKDLDVKAKVDAQCSISTTAVDFGIARARVELGRQRRLVHDYASASCWSTAAAVRRLRASTRTAS
jgi:hypothetical protein